MLSVDVAFGVRRSPSVGGEGYSDEGLASPDIGQYPARGERKAITVMLYGASPYAVAATLRTPPAPAASSTELVVAPRVEVLPLARAGRKVTLEDVLASWLADRSPTTIKTYKQDLKELARFLGFPDPTPRDAVREILTWTEPEAILNVREWLGDHPEWSTSTKARRVSSVRSLTGIAKQVGVLSWTLGMKAPKVEVLRDTRGPTEEQVLALLDAAGDGREGLRNRAMLALMAIRGLRRAEVVSLRRQDFDRPGPRIHVLRKGKRERKWLSLPVEVATAIGAWVDEEKIIDADAPLFHPLKRPGEAIHVDSMNGILKRISERVGFEVWPHALRHSAVTMGLEVTDGDVRAVQQLAGHANVTTTMRYDDNRRDIGGEVAKKLAEKLLGKREP